MFGWFGSIFVQDGSFDFRLKLKDGDLIQFW